MAASAGQRRGWLNLGLLVVVGLLVVIVWKAERPRPPSAHALIPGFASASVEHIVIHRAGRPELVFARTADGWRIAKPLQARANDLLMDALLAVPTAHSRHGYAAKDLELDQYGLAPPRARIDYGHGHAIDLGSVNPVNKLRYALTGGRVYLIQDALEDLPFAAATHWVSLSLLPHKANIRDLALPDLDIRARSPSGWQVTPRPRHFEADQVAQLLRHWTLATAYSVTAAKQDASTPADMKQIAVTLDSGKVYRFGILSTHPDLILRRNGLDYRLPASAARDLLSLPPAAPPAAPSATTPG
ncbi:hypothetical protein BJI67_02750 [Acidihalobacter aeolianus]|uniref:DUF4340 domain-containing protein n=1 Tax=Acidihalobacter aeolianus TaxID=2792603 RepID=A0A1D8K588_9GAMM|nr:DUF4340 domain-containing protein [Acidihalobacter aeolianus]AOV16127.1 hypothetical protein BJI67_02750 [Acidihalobacter aeolianus]